MFNGKPNHLPEGKMSKLKVGQEVKFVYHNKVRQGKIERLFNETPYPAFCVDHGDYYKSYRQSKAKFLVK